MWTVNDHGMHRQLDTGYGQSKAGGELPTTTYRGADLAPPPLLIDTGLDADAGAGAPTASAGSEGISRSNGYYPAIIGGGRPPLAPSSATASGVRCIATWLASTPVTGSGFAGANRRQKLQYEHKELLRQHHAERVAAEEIQARLSSEMRELRDQCHEQGQTVGMLTHRLADARDAVTAELRAATMVRAALGGELMSEESQRRALEAARNNEEVEVEVRIRSAQKQLAMMKAVRSSLEAQLNTSLQIQFELQEHIAAERGGCTELEVAGERELVAWNRHNNKVYSELTSRLQAEREEVESWRSVASRELGRFQRECEQQRCEESVLLAELTNMREAQDQVRAHIQAEARLWNREIEALRERLREADEEYWQSLDTAQRCNTATGACECERATLEEEVERCDAAAQATGAQDAGIEEESQSLLEELHELRESIVRCHEDEEATRLSQERDNIVAQVRQESELRITFEAELDALKRSRGILCWRRRGTPPPAARQMPPDSAGLRSPHPQNGSMPALRQPQGKGSFPSGKGGHAGRGAPASNGCGDAGSAAGGMRDEV